MLERRTSSRKRKPKFDIKVITKMRNTTKNETETKPCVTTKASESSKKTNTKKLSLDEKIKKRSLPYQCTFCDKSFKLPTQLTKHKRRIHPQQKKISANTENTPLLERRTSSRKRKPKFDTTVITNTGSATKNEVVTKPDKTAKGCRFCDKSYTKKSVLDEHVKKHHVSYQCTFCNKNFKSSMQLIQHQRIHTEQNKTLTLFLKKEPKLDVTFITDTDSVTKNGVETKPDLTTKNLETMVCNLCKKTYNNQTLLIKHVKEQHKNISLVECHYCCLLFANQVELRKHTESHGKICHLCKKGFRNPCCFSRHMSRHNLKDNPTCTTSANL